MRANKGVMAVGTYVDDLPILCNGATQYALFIESLQEQIPVVDLGKAEWFLSVEVNQQPGYIELHQQSEIEHIYSQVEDGVTTKTYTTPMEPKIHNAANSPDGKPMDQTKYRSIIGSLLYISEWTRPDLAFAVSFLSTKLGKATTRDWKYLQRVVKFLHDTKDKKLIFTSHKKSTPPALIVYSDSDWASDPNDRKSQTGYLVYIHGNLCAWKSAKQNKVALSSANSEYVALSEATREGLYFQNLLMECCEDNQKIIIRSDNKGAIKNAENELHHKRSKHIDIRHHFVKDEVESGNVITEYIRGDNNPADLLTKPVTPNVYNKLVSFILSSRNAFKGGNLSE